MGNYIARAKALVMKLDQNNVSTTKKETNRRILNGLPSEFDVEKNMFLLMTDTDPDKLGEALTRVEDEERKCRPAVDLGIPYSWSVAICPRVDIVLLRSRYFLAYIATSGQRDRC